MEHLRDAAEAAQWNRRWSEAEALWLAYAAELRDDAKGYPLYQATCCQVHQGRIDDAMRMLVDAVARGFRDLEHIERDEDLAPLRCNSSWPTLWQTLEDKVAAWERQLGNPPVRRELLRMLRADQDARRAWVDGARDGDRMAAIDQHNAARLREIVTRLGWPGRRLVGSDGARAAWLIAQHADHDIAFQRHCLELMAQALASDDVDPRHHAYLDDRVSVACQRPQRYGTQFKTPEEPFPIDDEANVDARRTQVGLMTLAQYKRHLIRIYDKRP